MITGIAFLGKRNKRRNNLLRGSETASQRTHNPQFQVQLLAPLPFGDIL
jgi:hypothetical protein